MLSIYLEWNIHEYAYVEVLENITLKKLTIRVKCTRKVMQIAMGSAAMPVLHGTANGKKRRVLKTLVVYKQNS